MTQPDLSAMDALRDALDDAIRRAYCEPVIPSVGGEDPDEVRAISKASILVSPARMRHLVGIQAAAWKAVQAHVEDDPDASDERQHDGD